MSVIKTKSYPFIPYNLKEIKRYCSCDETSENIINDCIRLVDDKLKFLVVYRELNLKIANNVCDFEGVKVFSKNLADNLSGCEKAIIFACTIGIEMDRLIKKYSYLSPSKTLILQGIGAERVESLCNKFNGEISKKYPNGTKPRFSAGFGDLPLQFQKQIFSLLECEKKIGLTLNSSLIMSPSKSVTAIIGIKKYEF